MELVGKEVLVTGGAGFIGSHLSEELLNRNNSVTVIDNLSGGKEDWIPDSAEFVEGNLTNTEIVSSIIDEDTDVVFHLASRKSVDDSNPGEQFEENTTMTRNILSEMRGINDPKVVYASSSVVYGNAPRPTPEDYAPLEPISHYGASKLAEEGLLSVYAHSYGVNVWNLRFANVVGARLRGAVIPDFIEKLCDDPSELTILGNGLQEKSYIHVDDCVNSMLHVAENSDDEMNTYNLGTKTTTSVNEIADIVSEELDVEPEYSYTGGEQGWIGDVPRMRLSIQKLSSLGWEPDMESQEAVRRATHELSEELRG